MLTVSRKCSACGMPLELDVPEPFASAGLVGTFCSACSDSQFLNSGGAILESRHQLEGARFAVGKLTITGGAIDALAKAAQHAATFLVRHTRGDWGENGNFDEIELTDDERRLGWEATEDSGRINKSNVLAHRDRVMSEYTTGLGRRLWIVTTLGVGGVTTVLLPEQY